MPRQKRPAPSHGNEDKARDVPGSKGSRRSSAGKEEDAPDTVEVLSQLRRRSSRKTGSGAVEGSLQSTRPRKTATAPARAKSKAKGGATTSKEKQPSTVAALEASSLAESSPSGVTSENGKHYYLMKAEPEPRLEKGVNVAFSIDDLKTAKEPEGWDARNTMREMKRGDLAFFYHSNCKTPGIAGVMEIVGGSSDDLSAQDPKHPYYDPKATADNPKWSVVHVEFRRKFKELVSLAELRDLGKPGGALDEMELLKQSRLSVSKVRQTEWDVIMDRVEADE